MYDTRQDIAILQQEDLAMFGRLVFALCCNNLAAMNNVSKAIETLGRQYSGDMKNVALFLISKPGPHKVRLFTAHARIDANDVYSSRLSGNCLT